MEEKIQHDGRRRFYSWNNSPAIKTGSRVGKRESNSQRNYRKKKLEGKLKDELPKEELQTLVLNEINATKAEDE